jgi:hypothetical protein
MNERPRLSAQEETDEYVDAGLDVNEDLIATFELGPH